MQLQSSKFVWRPCLVPMESFPLLIPWWLGNREVGLDMVGFELVKGRLRFDTRRV